MHKNKILDVLVSQDVVSSSPITYDALAFLFQPLISTAFDYQELFTNWRYTI